MNIKNDITTICLAIMTVSSFGQLDNSQLEPANYDQKLSYTEFETEYYSVAKYDLDNISLPDKLKMKELIYEREYEKFINKKGERTTIIKHISSENVYEDWMDKPEIMVIDKDAVSLYTFRGERVNRIEHSPTYLKYAEIVGGDLLPYFIVPNRNQLAKMEEAGMKIEDLGDGFMRITFKGRQKIYNEKLLYNESNNLNDNGEVINSVKINYMELPSGEIVVKNKRESTVVELDNNIKAKHIINRLYSDYIYKDTNEEYDDEIQVLDVKSMSNNTQIKISYKTFSDNSEMNIIIYSTSGKIVRKETVENTGINQISIQDLTPGIYIINIQSAGKTLSGKFIKL